MRVTTGLARGRKLVAPQGLDTRPSSDMTKQAVFNIVQNYVEGSTFLDLFAGSGQMGIEALSRGAKEAVFVENNPKAMRYIKDNLKFTRLEHKASTMTADVMHALYQLDGEKVFDIIFMDPPSDRGLERRVLDYLSGSELVYDDTTIIAEASRDTDFSYVEELGFTVIREKIYKTNKHVFIEKAGVEDIC